MDPGERAVRGFHRTVDRGHLVVRSHGAGPASAGLHLRIARDTRFSNDKSPYKTHIGAYIAPKGKKSGFAGYYFHIEPCADSLVGCNLLSAGLYCPEPTVLRSVREEILDNGEEIEAAVGKARGFRLYEGNKLKRIPTGFPADSEYAEMLKLKVFTSNGRSPKSTCLLRTCWSAPSRSSAVRSRSSLF